MVTDRAGGVSGGVDADDGVAATQEQSVENRRRDALGIIGRWFGWRRLDKHAANPIVDRNAAVTRGSRATASRS